MHRRTLLTVGGAATASLVLPGRGAAAWSSMRVRAPSTARLNKSLYVPQEIMTLTVVEDMRRKTDAESP
ncbi:MAG: hypothetical protein WKF82_13680 [Nocardioidaceae bacterium]